MKKSYWVIFIIVIIFLVFLVIANTSSNMNNEENILNIMNTEEVSVENVTTSIHKNNNTNFYDVLVDGVVIPQKDFKNFDVNVTFYDKNGKSFDRQYNAFNETEAIAFQEYGFRLTTEEEIEPYKMIIDIYGGNSSKTPLFTKEIMF